MIGAQSDLMGTDTSGSESVAGDKSNGSATRVSPMWRDVTLDPRTHIRLLVLVRSLSSQPSQAGLR